jgi:hypothetical protein
LLLQHHGTIRFLDDAQGFIKMVWSGDARCEERAVVEFFMAEKESVTNIPKQLKMYLVSVLLLKVLLVAGLHKLQVLRKAQWSS